MSRHELINDKGRWVFGWDQPLMSFFLQLHNPCLSEKKNPVIWLGATAKTSMYEVEDLVRAATKYGLPITPELQVKLYGEKDNGV